MPTFPAVIALSSLDGTTGFRLDGQIFNDFTGRSVSAAGDVNGDGRVDYQMKINGDVTADSGGRML